MEIISLGLENALQEFLFFGFMLGSLLYYYFDHSAYSQPWAIFTFVCAFYRLWLRAYLHWLPLKLSWADSTVLKNSPIIKGLLTFGIILVTGLTLSILLVALLIAVELSRLLL
jgi:hypothetical protein